MVANAASLPSSFAYVLQAEALAKTQSKAIELLASCDRDWIVIDVFYSAGAPWSQHDLETLRKSKPSRKILAYVSIGEAEDYRSYWKASWSSKDKPQWLGAENPNWKGNFPVKYWHREWQSIILATMDMVIEQGFDGVYLDIVDGFQNFEFQNNEWVSDLVNPETQQSFRRDMVDWVACIAKHLRLKKPQALVIPQNGSELLVHDDFCKVISGIGIEDLFTNGRQIQSAEHQRDVLGFLNNGQLKDKPILLIEYPKAKRLQTLVIERADQYQMTWLITDRALKTLGKSGDRTE